MSCKELVELVTEYLEGALPPPDHARFEDHITKCLGCAEYLEQMRLTRRLAGRLEDEPLQPPVRERLLETFRDWKKGR